MANQKFINKTVYTKEMEKKVAFANVFNKDKAFIPVVLIGFTLYYASMALRLDPTSTNGWVFMIAGFIALPVFFFLLPYIMTMKGYKDIDEKLKGEEFYVRAEFTDANIVCKNALGQTTSIAYSNIASFETNRDLIVIKDKDNRQPLYLDKNSFTVGNDEEFKVFMEEKIQRNRMK